jgi:hypothetical protein
MGEGFEPVLSALHRLSCCERWRDESAMRRPSPTVGPPVVRSDLVVDLLLFD